MQKPFFNKRMQLRQEMLDALHAAITSEPLPLTGTTFFIDQFGNVPIPHSGISITLETIAEGHEGKRLVVLVRNNLDRTDTMRLIEEELDIDQMIMIADHLHEKGLLPIPQQLTVTGPDGKVVSIPLSPEQASKYTENAKNTDISHGVISKGLIVTILYSNLDLG